MTHLLKKQSTTMAVPSSGGALGMHRDSRVISKVVQQPKIRIIHIFAPEIIKTDVANFRELVQQLTGKPSPENNYNGKGKGKGRIGKKGAVKRVPPTGEDGGVIGCDKPTVNTKLEVMMGGPTGSTSSPSSSDDQAWRSSSISSDDHHNHHHHNHNNNASGGFLTAFSDLDDTFDFSTVFQMGTGAEHHHHPSHLNVFGETATQLTFRG